MTKADFDDRRGHLRGEQRLPLAGIREWPTSTMEVGAGLSNTVNAAAAPLEPAL